MVSPKGSVNDANVIVAVAEGTFRVGSYPEAGPSGQPAGDLSRYLGVTFPQFPRLAVGGSGGAGWSQHAADMIYTDQRDMPSLEDLLAEHRVLSTVWERDAPQAPVAVSAGLAVAVAAIGFTLLGVHISGTNGPDPLISAFVALAGLCLIATLVAALRSR